MSDRLKFRVWDKYFNHYWTDEEVKTNIQWLLYPDNENIEDVIIEQCTGLKDKNGKLIFEGDIVKSKFNGLGRIIYNHAALVVAWKEEVCFYGHKTTSTPIPLDVEHIEVIGNIHTDKNLLEFS